MSNQFLEQIVVGAKVDTKGFKKADTALAKLGKTVKSVAGAVGLAYGASAITAYGKAAARAFAQDEAAALRLNRAVENLGIGFANPEIADYISKLEKSAAIADDILRPAFQGLLTTTGSLTQSQKLLNDAITISRSSGIDLETVTNDLAKGYVGVTKGLTKYNTGLTKAELASMSFNQILGVMLKRSAGAAEDYLGSTAYQMDVLGIATGNASEIIGGGLVDAFAAIGGGTEASDAAYVIESIATALAKVTAASGRTIGVIPTLIKNLKNLPSQIFAGFAGKQIGMNLPTTVQKEENKLTLTQVQQQKALAKLEAAALKRNKELLNAKKKQVVADKSKAALAKAESALGKGSDVFDIDKIQIAAAQRTQLEQLGKATDVSAALGITNNIARLQVKQDIQDLEDAITSGDERAIIAATNKLNADNKILGALQNQEIKVVDMKKILDALVPKDLINLANLDDALAKLKLIGEAAKAATVMAPAPSTVTPLLTPAQVNEALAEGSFVPQVAASGGSLGGSSSAGAYASSGFPGSDKSTTVLNVTNNFAVVGDPNAAAEVITDVIRQAVDRGTLRAS
jgi:hypothetical protein